MYYPLRFWLISVILTAILVSSDKSWLIPGSSGREILKAGKWEMIDIPVPNKKNYDNPYTDVTLDVIYTTPAGKEIRFWGFYDEGEMWRIRFMANETGRWRYSAVFSDNTPGIAGEFLVVNSDLPGMLSADIHNPLWFGVAEGALLIRGFHVGDRFFADNWSEEKRKVFLDWCRKQKYNFLTIASHYLNRSEDGRGKGWDTPSLWPLKASEYRKMEVILDDLAKRQIYVYPFAGFFGKKSNYPVDPVEQELYIRYILARIGPYWNIVFNVAGPEPNLKDSWMASEDVERLGKLISDLDPFDHLLTVHNATGDDPYRDSGWTTFGTLQGPKTTDRKVLSNGLLKNHNPSKPLLAQETLWPGNKYHPAYGVDDIRKNAIVILMSGATFVFGDFNGDSSSGFSGTMEESDRNQQWHDIVKDVWDFFGTLNYSAMRPAQDLVTNGYCLASQGNQYLVYLESGGSVDVKIRGGQYSITWIKGEDTSKPIKSGITTDGHDLRAPGDGDWFLHLAAL